MLRSIKSRLTLLYVAILAAILVAFAGSLYGAARWELRQGFDEQLQREARAFLETWTALGPSPESARLDALLRDLGAAAEVVDGSGVRLYSSGPADLRPLLGPDRALLRVEAGGSTWRYAVLRARDASGASATVCFGRDEAVWRDPLRRLLVFFAGFIPAVLLIAWYAGRVFVRGALAPVDALRRRAASIAGANLSDRIPVPTTRGEIRDLAITLNDMLGRLERSFVQVNAFTSNASHELKTPLANLRSEIELALGGSPDAESSQRLLASIAEEVSRMTRIVENLLLLAKLDSRQASLKQEPVDLSALAAEAVEAMEVPGEARGVKVRAGMIAPGVVVKGDAVSLRRVLLNLLENGVKYNREGGEVKLSVWAEDGSARVEVADTGAGIPAESVPRLFDRFFRVDEGRGRSAADPVGGHGLGLSISRSLVEAHGGRITVSSTEGVGSTFSISLPR